MIKYIKTSHIEVKSTLCVLYVHETKYQSVFSQNNDIKVSDAFDSLLKLVGLVIPPKKAFRQIHAYEFSKIKTATFRNL